MTPAEFEHRAKSVPFIVRGRSYDGWDCWGLVVRAYADVLGVELPTHDDAEYGVNDLRRIRKMMADGQALMPQWIASDTHRWGDVVLLRRGVVPCHVGVMVEPLTLLHTEDRRGTFIEDVRRLGFLGYTVEGTYVHRGARYAR